MHAREKEEDAKASLKAVKSEAEKNITITILELEDDKKPAHATAHVQPADKTPTASTTAIDNKTTSCSGLPLSPLSPSRWGAVLVKPPLWLHASLMSRISNYVADWSNNSAFGYMWRWIQWL